MADCIQHRSVFAKADAQKKEKKKRSFLIKISLLHDIWETDISANHVLFC